MVLVVGVVGDVVVLVDWLVVVLVVDNVVVAVD